MNIFFFGKYYYEVGLDKTSMHTHQLQSPVLSQGHNMVIDEDIDVIVEESSFIDQISRISG